VTGQTDERSSTFSCSTRESDRLGAFGLDTGNDNQRKSTAAQQFLRSTQTVLSRAWSEQNRTFLPEWTGDRSQPIDPRCSFALSDGRVTRCSQYSGCSTLWHPDRQSSTRQPMSWQNGIERVDSCRDWLRGPMCDRGGIRKPMLDERADGSVAIRHLPAEYPEENPKARKKAKRPQ
jgi:hypothetical protein